MAVQVILIGYEPKIALGQGFDSLRRQRMQHFFGRVQGAIGSIPSSVRGSFCNLHFANWLVAEYSLRGTVSFTEYSLKVSIYLLVLVVAHMAVQVILIGAGDVTISIFFCYLSCIRHYKLPTVDAHPRAIQPNIRWQMMKYWQL